MKIATRLAKTMAALICLLPAVVLARQGNTLPQGATSYEVGQGWVSHYFDEATQTRWFSFAEMPARSYCIEAVPGSATSFALDPALTAYADGAGTVPLISVTGASVASDNGAGDPYFAKGARACYISDISANAATLRTVRVNVPITAASGIAGFVRFRIVETTLVAPCFARPPTPAVQPNAYVQNLTDGPIQVRMRYAAVVSSGAILNGGTVQAYSKNLGSPTVNVNDPQLNLTSQGRNGVCFVLHDGPPGALTGFVLYEVGGVQTQNPLQTR